MSMAAGRARSSPISCKRDNSQVIGGPPLATKTNNSGFRTLHQLCNSSAYCSGVRLRKTPPRPISIA